MDLNLLQIFAKIAEYQSFTKAAKSLGIEKSTASNKISQLEKTLGTRLLHRTTRSVTLTEAGEVYYRYCQHIIESAQEANEFAQTFSNEPQGILRISAPLDFGFMLVKHAFQEFMLLHPKIKLDLFFTERNVDLVREQFDLALRIEQAQLPDSTLIAKKLFDIDLGFFASPQFIQQYGEIKTLEEAQEKPFILFKTDHGTIFKLLHNNKSVDFQPQASMMINDVLSCLAAAENGQGITVAPSCIALDAVANNRLVPILTEVKFPISSLYMEYPNRQWIPSKLKVFLEFMQEWGKPMSC